jgi:hypothetical protein
VRARRYGQLAIGKRLGRLHRRAFTAIASFLQNVASFLPDDQRNSNRRPCPTRHQHP